MLLWEKLRTIFSIELCSAVYITSHLTAQGYANAVSVRIKEKRKRKNRASHDDWWWDNVRRYLTIENLWMSNVYEAILFWLLICCDKNSEMITKFFVDDSAIDAIEIKNEIQTKWNCISAMELQCTASIMFRNTLFGRRPISRSSCVPWKQRNYVDSAAVRWFFPLLVYFKRIWNTYLVFITERPEYSQNQSKS